MDTITATYAKDAREMADSKIAFLGLDIATDIAEIRTDDGIRIWYTLKNSTPELEQKGIYAGDTLLVFQSLRYSHESLEKELATTGDSYQTFDTGSPFIGTLLKT